MSRFRKTYEMGIKKCLENLGVEFTVINLEWSPEDKALKEPERMSPSRFLMHTLATRSMSIIEDLDHDEPFEKVQWNEVLTKRNLCIVPTQIRTLARTSPYLSPEWV